MLNAVEFQAKIQNGLIQIPEEYKQELGFLCYLCVLCGSLFNYSCVSPG